MNLQSIFAAILAEPHELGPRQAFATLVGGAHGAFIEAQLRSSAALRAEPPSMDDDAVLLADELLGEHGQQWANGVEQLTSSYTFIRGFVELVAVDATWFTENWKLLFARAPIRHLIVHGLRNPPEFFDCVGLQQLVGLTFNLYGTAYSAETFDDSAAAHLARSAHLAKLRYLDASCTALTDSGKLLILRALPALQVAVFDDLGESVSQDYDSTVMGVEQSDGLAAFEKAHGQFASLQEVARTNAAVLRERY
jgi:hypothetical protein